jgi:phosphonate transport system substrate-binding protein
MKGRRHMTLKSLMKGRKAHLRISIDNFRSGGMDGAFFGSFTYALAHAKLGVEVLARPVGFDNTSTDHGLIFVRKDSGIRNVRHMKGKRFAYVDKATTAGYIFPHEYFREYGIVVNYVNAMGLNLATNDYTNDG